MNIRMNKFWIGYLAIILPLFVMGCGSSNFISGMWRGMSYEADIKNVNVITSIYGGDYNSYGVDNRLEITMNMVSNWGQFSDSVRIVVPNASIVTEGVEYLIGDLGISAQVVLEGSPMNPAGSVVFTKLSDIYGRKVCGQFYLSLADGTNGFLNGGFCGKISVGYDY